MKNIVLLGATGSIGESCLNVLRQNTSYFNLFGIAFGSNISQAKKISQEFQPEHIFIGKTCQS